MLGTGRNCGGSLNKVATRETDGVSDETDGSAWTMEAAVMLGNTWAAAPHSLIAPCFLTLIVDHQ